ncbi:uncharacterized protein LOC114647399 [Erpetoichthys calabaricus]|uniref:uncharacterized protein LOC114647399 n=1 Tax=Erpetoichthys calabaricus TaxID=27687 RepID=UPI0022346C97|nr:uncharacterized protein LOC114647399 [Erpetoichthys calabaricus]
MKKNGGQALSCFLMPVYISYVLEKMGRFLAGTTFLIVLSTLGFFVTEANDLKLEVKDLDALAKTDITLKCLIKNMPTNVKLENVGVVWTKQGADGATPVYTFQTGKTEAKRDGAYMNETELLNGDASLHLPNVQFEDEGSYTCIVYVTPSKGEKQFQLFVSERPNVAIEPKEVEVLLGNERSIECTANNFYPSKINIKWLKMKEGRSDLITDNICTGSPTKNGQGAFDILSRIIVMPELEDNSYVYRCQVEHRTFEPTYFVESSLRVKEPEVPSKVPVVLGILFPVLLLAAVSGFLLYLKFFKSIAPQVTELQIPDELKHKEKSVFSCLVSGFRPKSIILNLYLERERKPAIHISGPKAEHQERIIEDNELLAFSDPEGSFEASILHDKKHGDGTRSFTLTITIVPDIYIDNYAYLKLQVQHTASVHPIGWNKKINVIGVKPRINQILIPPIIAHGDLVALTCPINGFKPRPLIITWYKQKPRENKKKILCLDEKEDLKYFSDNDLLKFHHSISEMMDKNDCTHDVISVLTFIPSVMDDDKATFFCEAKHIATCSVQREKDIHVKATPKLDPIMLKDEAAIVGAPMVLSCRIHSYYPQTSLKVSWYLGDTLVTEGSDVGTPKQLDDGLFSCISTLKTVPYWPDVNKVFKCLVEHESLPEFRETKWTLEELVSPPKVYEILSDPKLPVLGMPLTLSCVVTEFYPKDCTVVWVRGFERMEDGTKTEEPEFDEEKRLYYRRTQRTFYPTLNDLGSHFSVEMIHRGITYRPDKDLFVMRFKGIPTVSEVMVDLTACSSGKPVTLSCNVTGFIPKTITAEWRQGQRTVTEGVKTICSDSPDKHGCYNLSSTLELSPKNLDLNSDYYFYVHHEKLQDPITRHADIPE